MRINDLSAQHVGEGFILSFDVCKDNQLRAVLTGPNPIAVHGKCTDGGSMALQNLMDRRGILDTNTDSSGFMPPMLELDVYELAIYREKKERTVC